MTVRAPDAIDRYLDELGGRLWLAPTRTRRILAEAEDHLREAATRRITAGDEPAEAQRRAIAEFGPVREVAGRFVADAGFPLPPSTLRELLLTAGVLLGVGFVAIGASGLLAEVLGRAFGFVFIGGDAPGITYTAERCAEFIRSAPVGSDCAAAAGWHHAGEVIEYRVAAGVLGLLVLGVMWLARRAYRGGVGVHVLPPSLAPAVGAATFGGAAVLQLLPGTMEVAFGVPGAGALLSGGLVSLVAFGWYARVLVRVLRTG